MDADVIIQEVERGDIGQSQLCKGSSEKGLSKPMVIGSSKNSSYGTNSASCAGGWTLGDKIY